MTSRILNRFNIKTDRLLRSIATDKLSCDIHPRKMIKMVRRVSRDHIIMTNNIYCVQNKDVQFENILVQNKNKEYFIKVPDGIQYLFPK